MIDYFISKELQRGENKYLLAFGVTYNLLGLVYFKYTNFFIKELNSILTYNGLATLNWAEVALPIGISFFTFHKISYLIDVARKTVKAEPSIINYLLYILLFPQLVAGPIIRYHDVNHYLKARKHTIDDFGAGLMRFCIGFSKKILIADEVGFVADKIFALPANELNPFAAWLGLLSYTIQIYFDFSAYSDMAIGLGRMIGFNFLENFNQPYLSQSITEFWKRWHISLSRWMKDYLYIPLGGNRVGGIKTYLNLWIVFIASGFWHGAEWTFLIWGCYHGVLLIIERFWNRPVNIPRVLKVSITFLLVMFSWLLFRANSIEQIIHFSNALVFNCGDKDEIIWGYIYNYRQLTALSIGLILSFIPCPMISGMKMTKYMFSLLLFIISLCSMLNTDFSPFLYFRF